MEYSEEAALKKGAPYLENEKYPIEVLLIDQKDQSSSEDQKNSDEILDESSFDQEELVASQLEARLMASKIKEMIQEKKLIYNPKTKSTRPVQYRDMVVLLRSMTWAPQIIEECKKLGIPVYANLTSGYFEATEVAIMMSLLKVIDNPFQDIPLASVLRSPIVGLDEEELSHVRVSQPNGAFYESVLAYCRKEQVGSEELYEKLRIFLEKLSQWRTKARQGALSELIWQLFRDTYFYDFVGGMPGGKQRQANLRALYDRARQYEATSFRGLFRFLRFIERMQDRGDDLGTARALGEQEDVVRIMTIHSSKGLEFPVVFLAGLARKFNMKDIYKSYLLDKEYGCAMKYVNSEMRITLPSLPQLAFKEKKRMEMVAEEMRVLYVALTRAKEKLYLMGTLKNAVKSVENWSANLQNKAWLLADHERANALTYLDWIGPSLVRHQDCQAFRNGDTVHTVPKDIVEHPSCWKVDIINMNSLKELDIEENSEEDNLLAAVRKGEMVKKTSIHKEEVYAGLSWFYDYHEAAIYRSKQSVSELKRQRELLGEESGVELVTKWRKPLLKRPRFMQEKTLTPAEKGTAMHMVMQQLKLDQSLTTDNIRKQVEEMVNKELLTIEAKEGINVEQIAYFFETDLGKRLVQANKVKREVPFSFALPASNVYAESNLNEPVLIQGIIDCLFEDKQGFVLLDYKTDTITDRYKDGFEAAKDTMEKRYQVQINLYTKALETILKININERYLYFFDGGHILKL